MYVYTHTHIHVCIYTHISYFFYVSNVVGFDIDACVAKGELWFVGDVATPPFAFSTQLVRCRAERQQPGA